MWNGLGSARAEEVPLPPPPIPLNAALGAGFTKGVWQNLDVKELRDQNLENTGVSGGPLRLLVPPLPWP